MKKIIFWICGNRGAVGELTQARLFCSQLPSDEYEFYLTANDEMIPSYKEYFQETNIKVLSFDDVVNINFDIVVISEYCYFVSFNFSRIYSQKEKEGYYYLLNLNVPVLIFDNLGFYDLYKQFQNNIRDKLLTVHDKPIMDKICVNGVIEHLCIKKEFEECTSCNPPDISIIYSCPPYSGDNNEWQTNTRSHYWRMPVNIIKQEEKLRKRKYVFSNILKTAEQANSKIVFLPVSLGQYTTFTDKGLTFYYFVLEKLLIHYMRQINSRIYFIIVSPIDFYYSGIIDNISIHNILIANGQILSWQDYESIFLSADLILTNNAIQHTFWRSLLNGIPGINITFDMPQANSSNYELTPFVRNFYNMLIKTPPSIIASINETASSLYSHQMKFNSNSVCSNLLNSCNILDEKKFIQLINKSLNYTEFINNFGRNKNKYMEQLSGLSSALDIIENL